MAASLLLICRRIIQYDMEGRDALFETGTSGCIILEIGKNAIE